MKPLRSLLSLVVLLTTGALCARAADTTAPSVPNGLAASLVQGSRVELVWTPATDPSTGSGQASGVTGYRVYRNGVQAGTCTTPSFSDTAGSPGATYAYTVTARDAAGNASPSSATLSVALGRVYYVAPSGNDANAGTAAAPWATLAKAAEKMIGGDIVYVRTGTYSLTATIVPPSGSAGRPITYAGYPGERATIDGGTGTIMSFTGRSYLTFDNLRFTTASTRVGASMFYMESSNSISFLSCEFFGMPPPNPASNENSSVIRCMRSGSFSWDCTFRNNYFHDNLSPAIRTYTTNGWIIENNTFVRCLEAIGGKDAPNNMLVRRNLIVGGDGAFYFSGQGGSHNVTITENIVINTGTGFVVGGLGTGGNLRESTFLFNNTFFNVANLIKGWDDGYTTAQNYYNNVFYATLPSDRSGGSDSAGRFVSMNRWGGTPIATDDYAIDYNLLQIPSTDPSDRFVVAGQRYQTLETWRAAFPGFDGHSISGDPLFIDAVGGDFHLQPTSPCRATGRGGVDMGAYPRGNDGTKIGSSLAPASMDIMPPSVPTGLAGTAQSSTSARLTWTASVDNVGVAGYRIYRDWVLVGTSPTPSFTNDGLVPATAYRFHLIAFDAAGNTCLPSSSIQVTTPADTVAPTAPTGLAVASNLPTQIGLTWTAATDNVGVTGYRIYRNGTQVGTAIDTNYTDTGLTTGTAYSYSVAAVDGAGHVGAQSAAVIATPLAPPPRVDSADGIFKEGATVVIHGANFGLKAAAAPAKFDSFESGTSGTALSAVDPSWKNYRGSASYSDVTAHSGSLSAGAHIANGEAFATNYFTTPSPTSEIFVSYWWRTANADAADNTIIKMTRLDSSEQAGGGGVYGGVGNTTLGGTYNLASQSGPYCAYHNGATGESIIKYLACPPNNTWFRVDMYKKLSTPGVKDGIVEVKLYGVDQASDSAAMTRAAGYSFLLDTVLLGLMDGNSGTHDYEMYIDDVYIDTTRARVEICDSPTWAARAQAETQPATAWSDSAITIKVNQGSIPPGATRYLYVVDAQGRTNAEGYPITFAASSTDTTAPTVPTGLAGSAASATAIRLTWTASSDPSTGSGQASGVAGYRIYRDGTQVGTTAAPTTTYTDTGRTTGTTYSYQVVAVDAAGNASGFSAAASVVAHDETYTAFAAWVAGNFTAAEQADAAISGPNADPDGAGLSNLARYAFGLPARGPVASPVALTTTGTGANLCLVLTFPRKGYAPDLQYTVQSSTDLVTWTDLQSVPPGYPKSFTFTDSAALGSEPRRFLRVRITQVVPVDDAPRR